jgi:single-strand DNA-binding protein
MVIRKFYSPAKELKMKGFNKIFILGRVGNDPALQVAKTGESYTRLSIATNRKVRGEDGVETEATDWHSVRVWGKQADTCSKYLRKGQGVMIEGYLSNYEATREGGEKEKRVGINAIKVEFLARSHQQNSSVVDLT